MAKYDMVIVGAGQAGNATAIRAVKLGLKPLVIERGRWPGEKNGQINSTFGHFGEKVLPGMTDKIPKEKLLMNLQNYNVAYNTCLYKNAGFSNIQGVEMDEPDSPRKHAMFLSYRNQWDKWLSGLAAKEGVEYRTSTTVVDVIRDSAGAVKGVITDKGERIEAPITIAADGTNSIIARKAGLRPKYKSNDVIIMVEMLHELGPGAPPDWPPCLGCYDIVDTELVDKEEVGYGLGWSFGFPAFMSPMADGSNKRYLLIGSGGMTQPGGKYSTYIHSNPWYLCQRMGQHPLLKPYVDNSTLLYMAGKQVPATVDLGCYGPTYADGIMAVGDAGIGTVWQGFGGFVAWECAVIAADVAKKAIDKGDVSAKVLKEYEDRWRQKRWVLDAAMEPYIHGKWGTDDGLGPLFGHFTRKTVELDHAPDYGFVDAQGDFLRDVILPILANMENMGPGIKASLETVGIDPSTVDDIVKAAKKGLEGGKK